MFRHLLTSCLLGLIVLLPTIGKAQIVPVEAERPGYLLVVGNTTDRGAIGSYAAALPPIYASHNAFYLAIGASGRGVTWLEGPWRDRSLILAKFPSRTDVDAFWWGEAYRAAIRKRDRAGVFSVVALQGTTPTALEGAGIGYLIVMTAPASNSAIGLAQSQRAADVLAQGVVASGGMLLTPQGVGQFTPMEGDTVFDRFTIAAWPTTSARDAYLTTRLARSAARLRANLAISAVASANGIPRAQAPLAVAPRGPVGQ